MATVPKPEGFIQIKTAAGPKDRYPYMALMIRTESAVNKVAGLIIHDCIETARQYETLKQAHTASGAVGKQSKTMRTLQDEFFKACGVNVDGQGNILRTEHSFARAKVAFSLAHTLVRYGIDEEIEDWKAETYPSLRARKTAWEKAHKVSPPSSSAGSTDAPVATGGAEHKVAPVECNTDSIIEGMATLLPFITLRDGQFYLPGKYDVENARGVFDRFVSIVNEAQRQITAGKKTTKRALLTLAEETAKIAAKVA